MNGHIVRSKVVTHSMVIIYSFIEKFIVHLSRLEHFR